MSSFRRTWLDPFSASDMLLTKLRPDEWISTRQVRSSFSLPVIREIGKHTLQSGPFALGWTLQCTILIQAVGKKTHKRLQAICNLYVLRGSTPAPPGSLSFRASIGSSQEQAKVVEVLTTTKCLGTFILEESTFKDKSHLAIKIMVAFPKDVVAQVTVPSVIRPNAAPADAVIPDVVPPDVAPPDLPPDVIPPDIAPPDLPPEVTRPDVAPPEDPLPPVIRPNPTLTYWSRVLKVIKSTLDNDGKLPIDLKFMVHTRMSPHGRIGFPKAVFASSILLEGYSSYLDRCMRVILMNRWLLIVDTSRCKYGRKVGRSRF
ncbi:uncharacterized protein BT62DRAFT_471775 [Guyanagaster necrorhizus]|uniref:Uncharacterized protein n=1 Tax=Guyanagaster necrorhizus TaxID=856835 RepID=A0A9P7VJZ3_9AGAR|nr:uncharacterized protein BT62DRAFT_471775 [Guyanagaster necrorhizus MCA 3950]KAG7441720.1 hypothetical protein BT62DRAFT_471775 [Guyanagaster necrorhizus MCA 3950]